MTDLPPELKNLYEALEPTLRRHVDGLIARTPDRVIPFLADRLVKLQVQSLAVEGAPPIPGLSSSQAAFYARLDPDRKAKLEAMPMEQREEILDWFEIALDPTLQAEAHRLLSPRSATPSARLADDDPDDAAIVGPKRRRSKPRSTLKRRSIG